MNNIRKYTAWLGAGAILITLATGCANKDGDAVPDATENVAGAAANTTSNMADAAGNTTSNMADATGNKMDAAGNTTSNMAEAAGNKMDTAGTTVANGAMDAGSAIAAVGDAAIYTPKIKTALGANAALKGSEINVDTLAEKKTIALRGTVKSSAQKTMAEAIAKKNAPTGYKIDNQLKMGGKM